MREIKFRAWDTKHREMIEEIKIFPEYNWLVQSDNDALCERERASENQLILMQYTGLKDKNGKEIYEGDLVGEEDVYHFLDRDGWEPSIGNWKIIGEKRKNFTGKKEERYVAGYELKTVVWKTCGFEPFCDSENNCGHCGGGIRSEDIEVIGNIYENPELLKQ